MTRFTEARSKGVCLIDLGCMQINHHFHGSKFSSVEAMIDPHANVQYATQFLQELKKREGIWTMAVARYHAGPNHNTAQKQYICRVATNMVATGFDQWTPAATRFCRWCGVRGEVASDAPNHADDGHYPHRSPRRTGADAPARNSFFGANSADYSTRDADAAY